MTIKEPLILGIESTCDETSIAFLRGRRILSNVIRSSMKHHGKFGGVIPEIASRKHVEVIDYVLAEALRESALTDIASIDAIAVAKKPGLPGSLIVGTSFARALAYALKKPLVGVNHIEAHVYANFLCANDDPLPEVSFPAVGVVVSGGHTTLYKMTDPISFEVIGQTRDDAVGEAFDKVAKVLSLGYPGGPVVERYARKARKPVYFKRTFLEEGSLDFSFSGIKTAVLMAAKERNAFDDDFLYNICAGFQESVFDVISKKAVDACRLTGASNIYVGGGVSVNKYLRDILGKRAQEASINVSFPAMELCLDNAAMTAGMGAELLGANRAIDVLEAVSG